MPVTEKRPKDMGHLIVIGGHEGAGASTISKMMARNLGMHLFSDEVIMRDIASKNGYSTLNKFLMSDYFEMNYDDIYSQLDDRLIQASSWHNLIIESRYFAVIAYKMKIPCTVTIWLDTDIERRARRYLHRMRKLSIDKKITSGSKLLADTIAALEIDMNKETERISKKFGISFTDPDSYNDIVFDSSLYNEGDTYSNLLKLIYDGKYLE